jgi:hypothetical protein
MAPRSVALHVRSGGVELEVTLDDPVDSSEEVLLGGDLQFIVVLLNSY